MPVLIQCRDCREICLVSREGPWCPKCMRIEKVQTVHFGDCRVGQYLLSPIGNRWVLTMKYHGLGHVRIERADDRKVFRWLRDDVFDEIGFQEI